MGSNVPTVLSAGVTWDSIKLILGIQVIHLEKEIKPIERKLKDKMSSGELRKLMQLKFEYNL